MHERNKGRATCFNIPSYEVNTLLNQTADVHKIIYSAVNIQFPVVCDHCHN